MTSTVVLAGVLHGGIAGATLGACALARGVAVEETTIWLCARRAIAARLPVAAPADAVAVREVRAFHRYYVPPAGTMLCFMLSSTLLTAGLARGDSPTLSLAVWPVAYSLVLLLTGPLNGMQQVAVRLGVAAKSARETRRLLLACGAAVSALLVALNAGGGTRWLFDVAINSPASTHAPALRVAWLLSALPVLVAARALCRGVLIARGRIAAIQAAILFNMATLAFGVLVVGPALSAPAYLAAALALLVSTAVETAYLARGALLASAQSADELAVA